MYSQYALWGIIILLCASTLLIGAKVLIKPCKSDRELWLRMYSWWVMAGLFVVMVALGRLPTIVFFGVISLLALKEYFSIISTRSVDKNLITVALFVVPLQYWWVWQGWHTLFAVFIPVFIFLIVPFSMMLKGETRGFLKAVGTLYWGLMATVFLLSHVVYLLALPSAGTAAEQGAGMLIFLVFLTQFNDVLQFCWGRLLGKTKAVPSISPSKTVEGLVGGLTCTVVLAWLIAPYLTPMTSWQSLGSGVIIGLGGFVGDVMMSAVKRDIGIKDTGSLIPGHGGILDRVDSLIVTAPLFFYYIYFLYF
jgi:phosphatidate cytidylyltransferase